MKVILISIGNFQEYIIENIKNLLLFNNTDITVITEKPFFYLLKEFTNIELIDCRTLDDLNFNNTSNLDKIFRNSFWHLCSLRLIYLYSYIKKYNISNSIHLENDVMLYENLDKLKPFFKNIVYATFDSYDRVIPGIIYIPNADAFKPIIENYNNNLNDMQNLAKFNETVIEPLPIYPIIDNINKFNKNYNDFNCIFDAAAMGQYLGGVDKRNQDGDTRGFINETCVIKYNNYEFKWIKENDLYKPYVIINNKLIQIINLHIHSKELYKFLSNNPIENKYIR
jgi:hypothetical protein